MNTKTILRIVPPGREVAGLRVGGAGLANLLWLWVKMVIANHQTGYPMQWPIWRQIKPMALLRKEWSMAYYPNLFLPNDSYVLKPPAGMKNCEVLDGDAILASGDWGQVNQDVCQVVGFKRLDDPFESFHEYQPLISQALFGILRPGVAPTQASFEQEVLVHIRRGDFRLVGFACDLSDYIIAMDLYRRELGDGVTFHIFTDADPADGEFNESMPTGATIHRGGDPLRTLLALASAKYLIGTARSSFSRMACYLGDAAMVWCGDDEALRCVRKLSPGSRFVKNGFISQISEA